MSTSDIVVLLAARYNNVGQPHTVHCDDPATEATTLSTICKQYSARIVMKMVGVVLYV